MGRYEGSPSAVLKAALGGVAADSGDWVAAYPPALLPKAGAVPPPLAATAAAAAAATRDHQEQRRPSKGASKTALVLGMIANLTQCIIGAGMLAVPHGFKGSSMLLGVAGLLFMGGLSALGFLAIGRVCMMTNCTTFRDAWMRIGGSRTTVDVILFLECVLTCVGYTILIGDYGLVGLSGMGYPVTRGSIVAACTLSMLLPLCLVKELTALAGTSALGLLAMLYAFLYVVSEAVIPSDHDFAEDWAMLAFRPATFPALTTFVSAYVAHYLAPAIWNDCISATQTVQAAWRTFNVVVFASFGLAFVTYTSFGAAGYIMHGEDTRSNVLTNYPAQHLDGSPAIPTLLCWLLSACSFVVSFPLIFRSARDTAVDLVLGQAARDKEDVAGDEASVAANGARHPEIQWKFLVTAMVILTNFIGVCLEDIGWLLALRGAVLGCPVTFVIPGWMLLRSRTDFSWCCAGWTLVVFGLLSAALAVHFMVLAPALGFS